VIARSCLTGSGSTDAARRTARRGEVAGGGTGVVEVSWVEYGERTGSGDDGSVAVGPRVTRLRVAVGRAREYVARFERSARRAHYRRTRTV